MYRVVHTIKCAKHTYTMLHMLNTQTNIPANYYKIMYRDVWGRTF